MRAMRALLDLLAPSLCDGCGTRAPPPWCATCDERARALRPAQPCPRCAGADEVGHPCWTPDAPVVATVALTDWRDPVARALVSAKLAGRAEVFRALAPRLAALVDPTPACVVPVATVRRRARARGDDHARTLARGVAGSLEVPCVLALRVGTPMPDRGRARAATRMPVPDGAFLSTARAAALAGRDVLLVDDVLTTGGTVAAAARALRRSGAASVRVAVLARAGRHQLGA